MYMKIQSTSEINNAIMRVQLFYIKKKKKKKKKPKKQKNIPDFEIRLKNQSAMTSPAVLDPTIRCYR